MLRFILYAAFIFFIVMIVRSTMRIRSSTRQWKADDPDKEKPPVLNIPDIQDAKFEDLTKDGEEPGESPKTPPKGSPPSP